MARKGWKHEFDMACLLGKATGVIENTIEKKEIDLSETERERRRIAIEVFKKLAPSNIKIDQETTLKVKDPIHFKWIN